MSKRGREVRWLLVIGMVLFTVISYLMRTQVNPITGEQQRVDLTPQQEVALGLEATPSIIQQHGGLSTNRIHRDRVDQIDLRLLESFDRRLATEGKPPLEYPFKFHLLADQQTLNAFALPGGPIFITTGLFSRLESDGQLAGVLGHEIGHVIERHSAQRLAKQKLTEGLVGAAGVGSDSNGAGMAQMLGAMVSMKYGREDELESDVWGVRLCAAAGYDPRAMIGVMKILDEASSGGQPEFMSTHPKPANRAAYIEEVIAQEFPNGVSANLRP
jgi:predicted Zn-dependent protease